MKEDQRSLKIRMAAFEWLRTQVELHGDVLHRNLLENGFHYENERVVLIGPKGIWKPKQVEYYPISLTSSIKSSYEDIETDDYKIIYKYQEGGQQVSANKRLIKAFVDKIPVIYFRQVSTGYYMVHWPMFVVANNPTDESVVLEAGSRGYFSKDSKEDLLGDLDVDYSQRKYVTREVIYRMHQRTFRENVLHAYRENCAICRLKHRELLDAAHIKPDSQGGEATIKNGLSLCKIHHAAFDRNFVAITPDYEVKVRPDLLLEKDGPMFEYGIKGMHNQKIILPRNKDHQPSKVWLDERFEQFKKSI